MLVACCVRIAMQSNSKREIAGSSILCDYRAHQNHEDYDVIASSDTRGSTVYSYLLFRIPGVYLRG